MTDSPVNRVRRWHFGIKALGALGACILFVALAWWWLAFQAVVDNGYLSFSDSVKCIGADSVICDLAVSLCKSDHLLGINWYSPVSFWTGLASLCAALFLASGRVQGIGTPP